MGSGKYIEFMAGQPLWEILALPTHFSMSKGETVLDQVFIQPETKHAKIKATFFPWTKRRSSSTRSVLSLAAPSDLDVVHDTVFQSSNQFYDAPYDASRIAKPANFNRWDHYLDLYPSPADSETSSLASYEVPDGSEYEPEEYMEDVAVQLPLKNQSKFRKYLRRASYSRITPVVDDATPPLESQQLVVQPKSVVKRKKMFSSSRNVSGQRTQLPEQTAGGPSQDDVLNSPLIGYIRMLSSLSVVLEPFERLIEMFPDHKLLIIALELMIAMWVLYQLSIVIETVALAVRALCIPLIIVGRVFGYL